jgi:O-antigen/teichoic acid export membrane protein
MKKDFIFTFLTQIIILLSGLGVFKIAIMQFGDIGFSEFSLVKRNLAYIYTFILLGLGVAIPRYIAIEIGIKSGKENDVFLSALFIIFFSLTITIIIFLLFPKYISVLLFGNPDYTKFLLPIFISLVGLSLHSLIYAYYRGKMIFYFANFLQIINIGIVPIIVFLFAQNIEDVFIYTGLIMSILSSFVLVKIFLSNTFDFKITKNYMLKLFIYGTQRLPADIGLASLLTLPVIFTSHTDGPLIAGYIAFSISLLNLSGQVVAPIGLIMLPKISQLIGENNLLKIHFYIKKLFIFSVLISIIGTIFYQLFSVELLYLYLGNINQNLVNISRSVMWAGLFYPVFITMRSVIDAYYVKSYNTLSILAALIFFIITYIMNYSIIVSFVVSIIILVFFTIYFIIKILLKSLNDSK